MFVKTACLYTNCCLSFFIMKMHLLVQLGKLKHAETAIWIKYFSPYARTPSTSFTVTNNILHDTFSLLSNPTPRMGSLSLDVILNSSQQKVHFRLKQVGWVKVALLYHENTTLVLTHLACKTQTFFIKIHTFKVSATDRREKQFQRQPNRIYVMLCQYICSWRPIKFYNFAKFQDRILILKFQ